MNFFITILVFVLIGLNLSAQTKIKTEANADIVEYSNKDGLPSTNFSNIVQTKDGYLWISGIEGTYRFNGYEFEEVGKKYGLPLTQAVYYDSVKNILYFASPTNFIVFDGGHYKVYGHRDGYKLNGLEGQAINFIQADSKGRIWIGSSTPYINNEYNGGLTKYENGIFTAYDSSSFPLHNATGFVETPYGDLIFSSGGKNTSTFEGSYIALYKNDRFTRIDDKIGIDLQNAVFMNQNLNRTIDEAGNTWIALSGVINRADEVEISNSGVLMYDGNSFHSFPGLEKYLNHDLGINSVHYNKFDDKIYATAFRPGTETFNRENKMIFEFKDGQWMLSDIIGKIGSIIDLKTDASITDFRYLGSLFIDSNKYFPELLGFFVTNQSRGGQGSKYPNQYFSYTNSEWRKIDAFNGIPMKVLNYGMLLTTQNGFGIYYPKDSRLFTEKDEFLLPNIFVPALYSDFNGIVWISYSMAELPAYLGINDVGLNIWDGKKLVAVTEKDGLSGNSTFMTFQDSKRRVWISTTKGATLCREIQNSKGEWLFKFKKIPSENLSFYNTTKFLETSQGEIFTWQTHVGWTIEDYTTYFYLGRFDGEKFIEIPSPFDEELNKKKFKFFRLNQTMDNKLLLEGCFSQELNDITTAKTHIMVFDGKTWSKAPESWNIPEEQLNYVGSLENGMYYLTVDGFYNFNGEKFVNLIDSVNSNADFRLLKGASVAGTKTDNQADGKLFIRLRNRGLVIFDGTHLNFYTKKEGLPSANLYNPTPDSKGNMMFSHPSGALIVKDNKFQNYYDDGSNLSGGANVTTLDGEGNFVMHYRGIGLFIKQQDHTTYPLKLSSVIIDTASYFYNFPENLSHNENSLVFNFAALNFKDPKQTNYEYILEGYDKGWSLPGNLSFAQYQNLPPGDYLFRVKGITSNGVGTNEASYSFIIAPPFWRTWWAYGLYICGFFAVMYATRRYEKRRMRLKEAERIRKERADARLREAELRAQLAEKESERKSEELEEARKLQLSMLPKELPQLPHLDIAVYMKTATEVGGDYYDFHVSLDGTLTAVIGDATGHGMRAGTMVTATKGLFNSYAPNSDILFSFHEITRCIKQMQLDKLAMCMSMLKIRGNKMLMSTAGMPPIFIFRKEDRIIEELVFKGMPLGTMTDFPYDVRETELGAGDTILLMTDGFPELLNKSNEQFGYKRARNFFEETAENSPEDIISRLKNEGSRWVDDKDPDDDVTFVVIKVK